MSCFFCSLICVISLANIGSVPAFVCLCQWPNRAESLASPCPPWLRCGSPPEAPTCAWPSSLLSAVLCPKQTAFSLLFAASEPFLWLPSARHSDCSSAPGRRTGSSCHPAHRGLHGCRPKRPVSSSVGPCKHGSPSPKAFTPVGNIKIVPL